MVYGTIDATSGGVLTNYSIDGAPAVQVSSQAGKGDTVKQQFWASPQLTLGKQCVVSNIYIILIVSLKYFSKRIACYNG